MRVLAMRTEGTYGIGTAFFVDDSGTVVTAAHVVADARVIFGIAALTGEAFPLAVAVVDTAADVAILRAPAGVAPAHIALASHVTDVSPGDEITVSGYSGGELHELAPAVTVGHVSRALSDGGIELSATVNPGQSGGPVLTASGELLGLLSARANPETGVIGVALIRPRSNIAAVLDRAPSFTVGAAPELARLLAFGASAATLATLTSAQLDLALDQARSTHERAAALLAADHYADSPDTADPALIRSVRERSTALVGSFPHLLVLYPSLARGLGEASTP